MARLKCRNQEAEDELETLANEGPQSGEPKELEPGHWEAKHRRVDERLKNAGVR